MQTQLKIRNIVVNGTFKPNAFDKLFFVKHEIFNEEEIASNSITTIDGAQIITKDFNLLIVPNQFIIHSNNPNNYDDKINEVAIKILSLYSPFNNSATGINFHWNIICEEKDSIQKASKNFYNDNNKILSTFFNTKDSLYGIYASKEVKGARLKFEVKPVKIESTKDALGFIFNFHIDIKNIDKSDELIEFLKNYDAYRKESEQIISSYK